ncbi:hypothetical protein [Clostridium pasteurianum]|uniref:Uncharacterized protein n=1 Tax=Clostridium pasteurianum BC1 TaxID=86416 RepID=R4KA46_CLOPA|nr:hypothetical protein [Clostridium pasteurianum]AGK96495.1 hypothetical protein Clopa_1560 [Clostridium pasteurianum BC1]
MKKYIGIFIIMFIVLILVITNTKKTDYVSWLKEKAISQTNNGIEQGSIELLGGAVIDSSTKSYNCIIFSVYSTNLPNNPNLVVIGILGNFLPMSTNNNLHIFIIYLAAISIISILVLSFVIREKKIT